METEEELSPKQDGKDIGVFTRKKQLLLVVLMFQMVGKCLWKIKCITNIRAYKFSPARRVQVEQKAPMRFST